MASMGVDGERRWTEEIRVSVVDDRGGSGDREGQQRSRLATNDTEEGGEGDHGAGDGGQAEGAAGDDRGVAADRSGDRGAVVDRSRSRVRSRGVGEGAGEVYWWRLVVTDQRSRREEVIEIGGGRRYGRWSIVKEEARGAGGADDGREAGSQGGCQQWEEYRVTEGCWW